MKAYALGPYRVGDYYLSILTLKGLALYDQAAKADSR